MIQITRKEGEEVQKPQMKWIGTDNDLYPNRIDPRTGKQYKPVAIVCHVMQGTLTGTDSHFNAENVDASTHFGIGKTGEIHQYVELKDGSWGNGVMQKTDLSIPWLKECVEKHINPNLLTVSIEHEGMHGTTFWTPTEAQVQASINLIAWLCWQLGLYPSEQTVIGHNRIDGVDRPYCPGPNFPFGRIIEGARTLLREEAKAMFCDLTDHWAKDQIETYAGRKLKDGTPLVQGRKTENGVAFQPDEPITRSEVVVLLERLAKYIRCE